MALLDIQSYDQLCGKLETLFIKRLLWEDCLRCSDLCVWRNQRTFVRFQTSISCLCPEKKSRGALVHDQTHIDHFSLSFSIHNVCRLVFASCFCSKHKRVSSNLLYITSRDVCGLRVLLYRSFVRKIDYNIQHHQKGSTVSLCQKKKNSISLYGAIQTL